MTAKFSLGWRQVAACVFLLAACSMIASAYSVVAIPLGRAFHPSLMMLTMTVMALVSGLLAPFLGNLMDRTSVRRLMLLGGGLLTAGFAALSLTTSFTQVLLDGHDWRVGLTGPLPCWSVVQQEIVGLLARALGKREDWHDEITEG